MQYYLSNLNRDFNLGFHNYTPFGSLLDRIFDNVSFSAARHFDIDETEGGYSLVIDMPGYRNEDIDVTIEADHLIVKAKKDEQSYSTTVALPNNVDADKTDAKLEHGQLVITLAKNASAKRRKIAIK